MVKNQPILEVLKELENLSHIEVKDPEDENFEKGKVSTFDEDEGVDKSFGNLRKAVGDDGVYDRKYEGVKSSRRSLNGWSDNETSDVETNEFERKIEEAIDDGNEILSDDSVDDIPESESESDNDLSVPSEDEVENDDIEDYNDGVDEKDSITDNTIIVDPNMIPNNLNGNMETSESSIAFNNFAALEMNDDLRKGEATKAQLDILDKLLESRIRMQKVLHLCNQLPQHNILNDFVEQGASQIKEAHAISIRMFKEMLDKLLKFQELLCKTNSETSSILTSNENKDDMDEEIDSDTEDEEGEEDKRRVDGNEKVDLDLPSKRKHTLTVMDYGEEIVKRRKLLQSFEESIIDKWHEKTRLASSNISSKNFSSFDRSITKQIKQVLLDKERLIKRTQLCRVPLKILGKENKGKTSNESDLHLQDYDENIFDDGDFYHEMLKELIDRKSSINSDDPVAAGRRWLELQKLRSKIKRKVDTRASKGRKVRYDVHSKLVSFMAPQNDGSMSNQARNELFASLFGQVTSVPIR